MNTHTPATSSLPEGLLLVCRGASCSERAGDGWYAALRRARPHCLTSCQGRCATGPNAVLAGGSHQLSADDLSPLVGHDHAA